MVVLALARVFFFELASLVGTMLHCSLCLFQSGTVTATLLHRGHVIDVSSIALDERQAHKIWHSILQNHIHTIYVSPPITLTWWLVLSSNSIPIYLQIHSPNDVQLIQAPQRRGEIKMI